MRQDEEFAPLRIVKKNITDFDRCAYRVYKSPAEYVTVDAATALEAFRESGIQNPLRIVRETRFMERLVDQARFTDMEELIETGFIMEAPAAITGHQEAAPPVQPEHESEPVAEDFAPAAGAEPEQPEQDAGESLSEDDIARLLGGDGEPG